MEKARLGSPPAAVRADMLKIWLKNPASGNNKEVSTSRIVRDKSGPPITRSYDMLGFLDAARPCTLLQPPIATPYVSGD